MISNESLNYIQNLENVFNKKFSYSCIDILNFFSNNKIIRLTIPSLFLNIDDDNKKDLIKNVVLKYNKYKNRDEENYIITDEKLYALTLMNYILRNYNKVDNCYKVVNKIEQELLNMGNDEENVVTVDKVFSLLNSKK